METLNENECQLLFEFLITPTPAVERDTLSFPAMQAFVSTFTKLKRAEAGSWRDWIESMIKTEISRIHSENQTRRLGCPVEKTTGGNLNIICMV